MNAALSCVAELPNPPPKGPVPGNVLSTVPFGFSRNVTMALDPPVLWPTKMIFASACSKNVAPSTPPLVAVEIGRKPVPEKVRSCVVSGL